MNTYICKAGAFLLIIVLFLRSAVPVFAENPNEIGIFSETGSGAASTTPDIPEAMSQETASSTEESASIPESVASTSESVSVPPHNLLAPESATSSSPVPYTHIPDGRLIQGNETWTKEESPYVLDGSLTVEGSLSIDPGVIVKIKKNGSFTIYGSLSVGKDTSSQEVVFTSDADDAVGGDTNNDGDQSKPDDNRWLSITGASSNSNISIRHAKFRYAGGKATRALCGNREQATTIAACDTALHAGGTLYIAGGTAYIRDSHFEWTGSAHIGIGDGHVTLEHDKFDSAGWLMNIWPSPSTHDLPVTMHNSSIADAPTHLTHKTAVLNFEDNWWGSIDGPQDWYSQGFDPYEQVSAEQHVEPWLTSDPFSGTYEPDPTPACSINCVSNVLFLPGMEGSKLYDAEGKLWDPNLLHGNADVKALSLDENGKSVRDDIVTPEDGVISSSYGSDIYKSFMNSMDALKDAGRMHDWKAVPYDWRLSLSDLLQNGAERDHSISYTTATVTPYLEQTLQSLAASSRTGKVTIIAHSNGGLVAKALLEKLGAEETSQLIDNIIFVGVPQAGAPQSIASLLYGYRSGIPKDLPLVVSPDVVRSFALNTPTVYHLLPSQAYFDKANDPAHQVATFTGTHVYQAEERAYGSAINSQNELSNFLIADDGGREAPLASDLSRATIANPNLTTYALLEHILLDTWIPPVGVNVYQVAGSGIDTVEGIDFYEQKSFLDLLGYRALYRPRFTEKGDGTVSALSAALMPTDTNVKTYWFDLAEYNAHADVKKSHGTLMSAPPVSTLIKNILEDKPNEYPENISHTAPSTPENHKIHLFVHSPVSLDLYDQQGKHTGLTENNSLEEEIADSAYGQFGEVKYILAPEGSYRVELKGQSTGTFSLDLEETDGDMITATSTIADVPIKESGIATLTLADGISNTSALSVDEEGDGVVDLSLPFEVGSTTVYQIPSVPTVPQTDDHATTTPSNIPHGTESPIESTSHHSTLSDQNRDARSSVEKVGASSGLADTVISSTSPSFPPPTISSVEPTLIPMPEDPVEPEAALETSSDAPLRDAVVENDKAQSLSASALNAAKGSGLMELLRAIYHWLTRLIHALL